ncbi:MAG: hypothetical protein Q7R41_06130 [Phycisphaerales bacterium]|nr:hypothetical protein [Phycisphaerales bacterium]
MNNPTRMSPLTALFLGIFFVGAVTIGSAATVILYGMRIIDSKASALIRFAGNTVEGLPELVQSLPPAIGDILHDRRAPDYAGRISVDVKLSADEASGTVRPVLTVKNGGDEVVSLLAVRVAALDAGGVPVKDWTEVVATPLAIDDDWRGPLMPGATRYVVLSGSRSLAGKAGTVTAVAEIGDVRVWVGSGEGRTANKGTAD